jgi:putative transposase
LVKVPKLNAIKAKVHRPVDGKLKSITLSRTVTGKRYASLLYETQQAASVPLMNVDAVNVIGLDKGLSHLAIDSTGRKVSNPRFMKQAPKNLTRKQQALSRKQKYSAKRAKARLLVAKAHERMANARNDFQHKLSRQIVDDQV